MSYTLLTCAEMRENGRDYGQLKPTLCWPAGVTKSGQECSPRLILSVRTNSAASTYVWWIIDAGGTVAQHKHWPLVRSYKLGQSMRCIFNCYSRLSRSVHLGTWTRWRELAGVQSLLQNGKERGFVRLWTWWTGWLLVTDGLLVQDFQRPFNEISTTSKMY